MKEFKDMYNCLIDDEIKTYDNNIANVFTDENELKKFIEYQKAIKELEETRTAVEETIDSIIDVLN